MLQLHRTAALQDIRQYLTRLGADTAVLSKLYLMTLLETRTMMAGSQRSVSSAHLIAVL